MKLLVDCKRREWDNETDALLGNDGHRRGWGNRPCVRGVGDGFFDELDRWVLQVEEDEM